MDESADKKTDSKGLQSRNFTLFMASNQVPLLPYGDYDSVWKRIRIVPFVDDNGNPIQS